MKTFDRTIAPSREIIRSAKITETRKYQLDNGLPVYAIEAGDQDLLKIEFVFSAGSWYQDQPLQAHFTNKILCEGTQKLSAEAIAEAFDFHGAYLMCDTGKHTASLDLYSLNKHLDSLLPVLQQIICEAAFPQKELDTLLLKARQQYAIEQTQIANIARHAFFRALYGSEHPYGYTPCPEDFDKIDITVLKTFYQKYYKAINARIIVAGKLPPKIIERLNTYFGHRQWLGKRYERPLYETSSSALQQIHIPMPNSLQTAIRIGKTTVNKLHPDYIGLVLLNMLLGGYMGSRLMRIIREEKGYTYDIHSVMSSLIEGGYFAVVTTVNKERQEESLTEIRRQLRLLRHEIIDEDELQMARSYLMGEFLRAVDGPFALAEQFKNLNDYWLDNKYYDYFFRTLQEITPEHLQRLAGQFLHEDHMTEVVVG